MKNRKKSQSSAVLEKNDLICLAILVSICAVLFFSMPGLRSLHETDEARYAEIAREMLVTGDWVTPHLNYVKYFEKPPLTYWLVALSFKIFGVSDASARFVPMFFGTCTVLLCFFLARSLWNSKAGFFAGGILATSLMFLLLSRILLVDMVLCFSIVLSLYGAFETRQEKQFGPYAFWVGLCGAFLSKGLLGPGLVVIDILIFAALAREWDFVKSLVHWKAISLCALLSLPWVIWVSIVNPEFFTYFFIDEHLGRLLTNKHQRHEPIWYYLPILPAAVFPWVVMMPWGFKYTWPGKQNIFKPAHRSWLFVMVWAVWFFFFLSISSSKMLHYILPVLPSLALLMGQAFSLVKDWSVKTPVPKGLSNGLVGLSVLAILAGLALLVVPGLNPDIKYEHLGGLLIIGPLVATAIGMAIFCFRKKMPAVLAAPVGILLVILALVVVKAPQLDDYRSVKKLTQKASRLMGKDDIFANYGDYYHGAVFYSGRRVLVVDNWGELDFGRIHSPNTSPWFIKKDTEFLRLLQNPKKRVVVISEIKAFDRLKREAKGMPGLLLFEWKRCGDKVLFSNRPAS